MAKSKQQKKKDREKRVAKQKLANAAKRRAAAKEASEKDGKAAGAPRGKKVITAGVKSQAQSQVQSAKPTVTHRRTGG